MIGLEIVKVLINFTLKPFGDISFNLDSLLKIFQLDFLTLSDAKLIPYNHYYLYQVSPKYDIDKFSLKF